MKRTAVLATLILAAAALVAPAPAAARAAPATNAVVAWNVHAQHAVYEVARQPPYVTGRSFAMVQAAVYDAVNAVSGVPYEPFLTAPAARRGDSVPAAVAAAAYSVLLSMFPGQAADLKARYDAELAAVPDGRAKLGGLRVGQAAARAMIASREGDGAFSGATWTPGTAPGQWRPTPPAFAQDGAWVADLRPFAIRSADQFRTPGPPPLTSAAYARDLNEVEAIGSAASTVRTADQTDSARWWHDARLTEWEIKRQLAQNHRLTPLATARMFAMADVSYADALTACFNEKKHWNLWRPITAIRLADTDGNPATTADPAWTPLLNTPPFPDYTSGHACFTSAIMSALRAFFGRDDVPFHAFSADSGTTRSFTRFSQATAEVVEARIWGGIHFRTADTRGAAIGERTAAYILSREFRPRR